MYRPSPPPSKVGGYIPPSPGIYASDSLEYTYVYSAVSERSEQRLGEKIKRKRRHIIVQFPQERNLFLSLKEGIKSLGRRWHSTLERVGVCGPKI